MSLHELVQFKSSIVIPRFLLWTAFSLLTLSSMDIRRDQWPESLRLKDFSFLCLIIGRTFEQHINALQYLLIYGLLVVIIIPGF